MPEPHDESRRRSGGGSPGEWFRFARGDFVLARIDRPKEVPSEYLCFHAQQAVEKALKALLVYFGRPVPRIHNLAALMTELSQFIDIPPNVKTAAGLTVYAVVSRYPGDFVPIEEDEYREAVGWAEDVLEWVTSILE